MSADPFTTSPNTQLFYNSTEHRQCLEGLELAIRMRRGLSVIQGGVGVGKTTISRKLIQLFEDESDIYDFYLILNPKFETEMFLLQHLIELFGIGDVGKTIQECRDILESYLLKVGIDEGKILVLIVDEGQNLDGKYLDVFRTLLNFETDDYKLLQLIIFGQPEMENIIQEYPNFEDRISFHYKIGPLDLDQMRGFIYHRLKKTGAGENNWFTDDIIELIYNYTNGYPRKVNKICHQLLLHMIGDKKDGIDSEIFQNVIDGKLPTGLLKERKPEPSEASANKLLNVLRRNKTANIKPDPVISEEIADNDIIGNQTDETPIDDDNVTIGGTKIAEPVDPEPEVKAPAKPESVPEPVVATPLESPNDSQIKFEPATGPGKFPKDIQLPLLLREDTVLGIAIDGNKIVAVSLQDHRKTKRLIDVQLYEHSKNIDLVQNPVEAMNALKSVMEMCKKAAFNKDFLTKKIIDTIANGSCMALSINSPLMQLKKIDIPKDGQNDRKKIIAWNAKKQLSFDPVHLQYDFVNQRKSSETILVGTTNRQTLLESGDVLSSQNWSIRWWHPVTMAIHNSFIWNYAEESKETCYVLHMGETESYLLGYAQGFLQVVSPIAMGIQNLKDSIIDPSPTSQQYRVPPSLLPGKAKPGSALPTDDQFRPVIENWARELDRSITSFKRSFPSGDETKLFISGTGIYIESLHEYLGGHLQLKAEYFNPLRNIAILPDESERDQLDIPIPLLTAAVGSALNLGNTVNLLPSSLKQNESFRLLLKSGIQIAAALFIGLFTFTGWISIQNDQLSAELVIIEKETTSLEPGRDKYYFVDENKKSVEAQVDELSFDTEYFERILLSLRYLSLQTPDEITFDEIRFQMGWEKTEYYSYGQSQKAELKIIDPHLRILKLSGTVSANSAYKDRILQIYLSDLEESSLFSKIEVMNKHTTIGLDVQEMTFVLKCIL